MHTTILKSLNLKMDFKKFEDEPDNENSRKVGDNTNAHLTDNSGTSGGDDDVRLGQLDFEFRRNPVKTWFRMMFPHLKIATLSVGFVIIFVIIYLFQLLLWRNNEWKCVLYSLGSDFTPAIKRWQVQRLITADFLHNDWAHLLWNCFVLLSTGCNAEHYLKILPYAILAFASIQKYI